MMTAILGLALATAPIEGQHPHDPVPLSDPDYWILIGDFPASAPEGEDAFVSYHLTIDPQGEILSCSGRDRLRQPSEQAESPYVARTCELLRQRARFTPATDSAGQPIAGEYSGNGRWSRNEMGGGRMITRALPIWFSPARTTRARPPAVVPAPRNATLLTDLEPIIARIYLSRARREGIEGTVQYTVVVGPDGRVTACTIRESSGFALLDERTCEVLQRFARFDPAIGDQGTQISEPWSGVMDWRLPLPPPSPEPALQD